jgi:hypothetical protein
MPEEAGEVFKWKVLNFKRRMPEEAGEVFKWKVGCQVTELIKCYSTDSLPSTSICIL